MALFQKSVIKQYLKNLDKSKVSEAYEIFQNNFSPTKIEKIKNMKEEEYQDGFLRDLFVDVLGYTLKPEDDFNLVRERKNETDSKKADGAIIKDDKVIAVIELKSTATKDLKAVTDQAFGYKNNQSGCKYVITSNFQKLRFYIDYTIEFEEFDLFSLSKEDFEKLYLILSRESIFSDLPSKLKKETKLQDEIITNKLYRDYSVFKDRLYQNLIKNNPQYDKLTLFQKSQKLLDRFLFILFAEDSGLLPPNSISRIIQRFDVLSDEDAYKPLYEIYKQYFGYMNTGREGKTRDDHIPAYNGGLFYSDETLDSLIIDDDVLKDDLIRLSTYDFNTEVDVNILGHIFEHSLSEIEEITAEIEGVKADKTKSRRKKDGVFYTPKYITQYIVENTIGTLCREKRQELEIVEIEFDGTYRKTDGTLSVKGKTLFDKLESYQKWLLTLKIVDPACGSGAFLNQALNFLIQEHKTIDDIIAELTNSPLRLFDTDKAILENNLYGVDINEESVEIAKLSLWLRTAHKDRKLSNLNDNIKCGNSLIDDPEVAGAKAFDWAKEFPDIMKNGGFDVVIGNPPYVFGGNVGITDDEKEFFNKNYKTSVGKINLFTLFIEKSFNLLKEHGEFAFIIPNTFLRVTSYHESRKYFIENFNFRELADLGSGVFDGVVTTAILLVASKEEYKNNTKLKIIKDFKGGYSELDINQIRANDYIITSNLSSEKIILLNKMNNESILLGDECKEMIFGVVITKNKDEVVSTCQMDGYKPFLEGRDINSYIIKPVHQYLNYVPNLLHRARKKEIFEADEKLLVQRITGGKKPLKVAYDCYKYYNKESINNIILMKNSILNAKYILVLLNSKLINWFYNNQFTNESNLTVNISKEYLSKIPIKLSQYQDVFIGKAELMLDLNKQLQEKKNKFISRIKSNFEIEKITNKLDSFYEYDFKTFVAELKKQKNTLSLKQQDEWEEYFNSYKTEINDLQAQIAKTGKEIDKMVYELYGLSEEEVKIVEGSVK